MEGILYPRDDREYLAAVQARLANEAVAVVYHDAFAEDDLEILDPAYVASITDFDPDEKRDRPRVEAPIIGNRLLPSRIVELLVEVHNLSADQPVLTAEPILYPAEWFGFGWTGWEHDYLPHVDGLWSHGLISHVTVQGEGDMVIAEQPSIITRSGRQQITLEQFKEYSRLPTIHLRPGTIVNFAGFGNPGEFDDDGSMLRPPLEPHMHYIFSRTEDRLSGSVDGLKNGRLQDPF